jgi:hypothetical protein
MVPKRVLNDGNVGGQATWNLSEFKSEIGEGVCVCTCIHVHRYACEYMNAHAKDG